LRIIW